MKRIIAVPFMALALASAPGCRMLMVEPLRTGLAMETISAKRLGFSRGKTTFAQAEKALKSRGTTGLAENSFEDTKGRLFQAITADYQREVHVFTEGRYRESIKLRPGTIEPYGFALRFASYNGKVMLLAMYGDAVAQLNKRALERTGIRPQPPRIEVFSFSKGSFRHYRTVSLELFYELYGGLTDPLIVGYDLRTGLTLGARGNNGTVWPYFAVMKIGKGGIHMGKIPRAKALQCGCFSDHFAYGKNNTPEIHMEE